MTSCSNSGEMSSVNEYLLVIYLQFSIHQINRVKQDSKKREKDYVPCFVAALIVVWVYI